MKKWWRQLRCFAFDHIWKSDLPLSLNGEFAVLGNLWRPPSTCRHCGKHIEGINIKYAEKNGWLEEKTDGRRR